MNNQQLADMIAAEVAKFYANDDRDTMPEQPVDRPLAAYCDHSVLRAYTSRSIVKEFCKEAVQYGAASVAVNPCHIKLVSEELKGTGVLAGAAIGFPLGATTSAVKAFEVDEAINNGAGEVDMVINVGALKDKDYEYVYNDIKGVVDAAKSHGDIPVKVILETCYLTDDEKIAVCVIAREAGADWLKTSTGMGTNGATVEDVKLMYKVAGDRMQIKAAGNVTCAQDVITMAKAGATRMGVSRVPQIATGDNDMDSASKHNKVFE